MRTPGVATLFDCSNFCSGIKYIFMTRFLNKGLHFLLVNCLPLCGIKGGSAGGGGGGYVSGVRQEGRQVLQIPLSLINLSSSL